MEAPVTKIWSQKSPSPLWLGFFLVALWGAGTGCASSKKVATPAGSGPTAQAEANTALDSSPGLPDATRPSGADETYGPPIANTEGAQGLVNEGPITLVLGPGLARGFAYCGVLRALSDAHIPVGAVLGTEMGALIASLYAMDPNINQFEWNLLKFKEDVFLDQRGFIARLKNDEPFRNKKLEARLEVIFGGKTIETTKIPLRISAQSKDLNIPLILQRGDLKSATYASLAVPGFLAPGLLIDGQQKIAAVSAGATRPFLVREAKLLGTGPVVVINVLSDAESAIALDELKEADLVIHPEVADIEYRDFQKRTAAIFQGKKAVTDALPELHRLMTLSSFEKRSTQP